MCLQPEVPLRQHSWKGGGAVIRELTSIQMDCGGVCGGLWSRDQPVNSLANGH